MEPPIDRLAYADCAFAAGELRARERDEAFAPRVDRAADGAACPACGHRRDAASAPTPAVPLSTGELDALHFRFWSADRRRFDHIGFAHAVIAACARATDPASDQR